MTGVNSQLPPGYHASVFQQPLWILARFSPPLLRTLLETPGVIAQIVFMLFVLATAPIAARSS